MAKSFSDVAAAHATIFGLRRSSLVWRLIVPLPLALIGAIVLTWVLIPRVNFVKTLWTKRSSRASKSQDNFRRFVAIIRTTSLPRFYPTAACGRRAII